MRKLLASTFLATLLATSLGAQSGTYTTFGAGCGGSDLKGHVTPKISATTWGNTQNAWPIAATNQRFQQEIDASEMPTGAQPWTLMAIRKDLTFPPQGAQANALAMWFGTTTYTSATLTSDYAKNANGSVKMVQVFKGTVVFPAVPNGNTDLKKYHYVIPLDKPYIYLPLKSGENFLIEVTNSNTTQTYRRYADAFSGTGTPGSRVYNSSSTTATTGSLNQYHMLAMLFGNGAIPTLSNTGVPTINQSFSVDLSQAKASSAAGLILGASTTVWGPINLPLDLKVVGATGCNLLVSFDALGTTATDATGNGSIKFGLPNDSSLLGVGFHNQYFVLDKEANGLGLSWSNGGTGKIDK